MSHTPPRWSEITALFGGTFDPPHLGHREAIQGLLKVPGVKRVIALPSAIPPQKPSNTPIEHRLGLLKLVLEGAIPESDIDDRELKRTGPSYTADTLIEFKQEGGSVAFVVGTDQLPNLSTWHRFPELLTLSHWIVLERALPHGAGVRAEETLSQWQASGLAVAGQAPGPHGTRQYPLRGGHWLILAPTEARAISSTAIREGIARTGAPPPDSLPSGAVEYLKRHRLYGTSI